MFLYIKNIENEQENNYDKEIHSIDKGVKNIKKQEHYVNQEI